jgi:hypothetical protein
MNFKWMISPPAIRIPERESVTRSSEILDGNFQETDYWRICQVATNPRAALRFSSSSARRKFRAS